MKIKTKKINQQQNKINDLQYKLIQALKYRFAPKSEKQTAGVTQLNLLDTFDEPAVTKEQPAIQEADASIHEPTKPRNTPKRKPLPQALPRVEVIQDVPAHEQVCACGSALTCIGDERSEKLEYIPAKVQVIVNVRKTYACKACEDTIKTAPVLPAIIPKSIATPSLLSHIAVAKYDDHQPLYRRKFFAITQAVKTEGLAHQAMAYITELYAIESTLREQEADHQAIYQARQAHAKPIALTMGAWLKANITKVPQKSPIGAAMQYALNCWPNFTRYLDDGRLHIDNNLSERAIKPFVIGRKNWMFCGNTRGAIASANLFSLIETTKAHGHHPYNYLNHVFTLLPLAKTPEQLQALLPYHIDPKQLDNHA